MSKTTEWRKQVDDILHGWAENVPVRYGVNVPDSCEKCGHPLSKHLRGRFDKRPDLIMCAVALCMCLSRAC